MTTIKYFIPEDGDLEIQPNVFIAPKASQPGQTPTLGQIRQAFPLPGRFHFRFKSALVPGSDPAKSLPVWMDCVDDRQPVQTWRSQIIAKVTRLSVEDDDDDDDDDEDFQRPPAVAATVQQPTEKPPPQQTQQARAPPVAHFDIFDGPASAPVPQQQQHNGDLLGGGHDHISAVGNSGGGGLLDMNYHSQPHQQQHNDFLGMSSPSPPMSGNFGMNQPKQTLRQQGSFDTFGSQGGAFF